MRWHPRPALQRRRTIHAGRRTKKQEQLISTIDNQVQHALAPEAGTSAAADDPRGSAQHADGRPPPMGDMSPVDTRVTDEALVTHDGSIGISSGAVIRGVHKCRQQAKRVAAGLSSEQEPEREAADDTNDKTVREIFVGTEAGTSAAAGDPSGSTLRAAGRPPTMGEMTPVEARATEAAFATHDGSFGSSTGVDEFQRQNDRESLT